MSCLPDIFASYRSEYLPPTKVGGVYSINLRQCHYTSRQSINPINNIKVMKKATSFSLDNRRYRSWTDTNNIMTTNRSLNKSHLNTKAQHDRSLEENEQSLNKQTHQRQVESVSNFNLAKRTAFETLHLAQRTLQFSSITQNNIKSELAILGEAVQQYLHDLKEEMTERITQLQGEFKVERREAIKDLKTLSQQLEYLHQEMETAKNISQDAHDNYARIIDQFI